jgi:hypothetical protein
MWHIWERREKPEEKSPLGRLGFTSEYNIKMNN